MPIPRPDIPLPATWPEQARSAVLYAVALAHYALAIARGWCANSRIARVRLAADNDRLKSEVALLREELRIKDARMAHVFPRERPHYPPAERMAILQWKAARNWSAAHTAGRFLLTATTIADWMKRLDDQGPDALVQLPQPVNRSPDFVSHIVQTLKFLCPTMGRRRIADTPGTRVACPYHLLRRAGRAAHVAPSTSGRTVTARYPDHVWNIDLTVVPTAAGMWIPMFPGSLLQRWPFAW